MVRPPNQRQPLPRLVLEVPGDRLAGDRQGGDGVKNMKKIVSQLEAEKKKIAKARDRIRELLGDVEGMMDSSTRGLEDLESAIDALSEYV